MYSIATTLFLCCKFENSLQNQACTPFESSQNQRAQECFQSSFRIRQCQNSAKACGIAKHPEDISHQETLGLIGVLKKTWTSKLDCRRVYPLALPAAASRRRGGVKGKCAFQVIFDRHTSHWFVVTTASQHRQCAALHKLETSTAVRNNSPGFCWICV